MPALLRRRLVPLPTVWGWVFLAAIMLGGIQLARWGLYPLLAVTAPVAQGSLRDPAQVLVVEGWLDASELDQVLGIYQRGPYGRITTTGGPLLSWMEGRAGQTYADRAAEYLLAHGPAGLPVEAVSAPKSPVDRTYTSARAWQAWAERQTPPITRVDVVSTGVHARRSRQMFRLAAPRQEVGIIAVQPALYEGSHWWDYSEGVKKTLVETFSVLWSTCCFWPELPSGPTPPGRVVD